MPLYDLIIAVAIRVNLSIKIENLKKAVN